VLRFVAVLALCLAILPTAQAEGSIESVVDAEMPASGVPGMAYAVVADGEITHAGARGVVRIGDDIEVTPDTPFLAGSISKSFTALAVMQLVEASEVELDAAVSEYLVGYSGRPAGAVTIRQLLSHTSGFSTLQGNTSHTDATSGNDALERWVDALIEVAPAYPPGKRWEYSNTN
jgi:CubicO group peptidase (beta-lactamase class C family)